MRGQEAIEHAIRLGFAKAALLPACALEDYVPNAEAVRQGIVADPFALLPSARSVLVLAMPFDWFAPWPRGYAEVSAFYFASQRAHLAVRALASLLEAEGVQVQARQTLAAKVWGQRAGFGVMGRNGLLHNDQWGTRFTLRTLVTDIDPLPAPDPLPASPCGACRRCVNTCPTGALNGDGTLNTDRCLRAHMFSGNPVPLDLRPAMGTRLLGCEICQRVCPYNTAAPCVPPVTEPFALRTLLEASKQDLETVGRFVGKNEARRGRIRAQAAIAAGNSDMADLLPVLQTLSESDTPVVAEHAAWAAQRLRDRMP